jgi:hypothetical protein
VTRSTFVHISAEVHEGRHQHDVLRDVGTSPRHSRRDDPDAGRRQLVVRQAREFGGHLVVERERLGAPGAPLETHGTDVGKTERKQNGFLDPLVCRPCAADFFGDAQLAGIESGDHLCHRVAHDGG